VQWTDQPIETPAVTVIDRPRDGTLDLGCQTIEFNTLRRLELLDLGLKRLNSAL